ncbi:MAG: HAMP domain-containing histidine kinase [Desulfuromonadales bacterium]|nr:HAMP domain-containing histidine kinase [Desulfuromonadales bacterium]
MTNRFSGQRSASSSEQKTIQDSIFTEILKGLKLGIIVLDTENRFVFFHNHWANEILKDRVGLDDYDALCDLFMRRKDESREKELLAFEQRQIRLGNHILGYTVYHPLNSYVSILFQDITEKARLESIAEAVESTNSLGYIFSQIRHELGNPTNSIKMTMEVLRNNINTYSKETILNYVERALSDLTRVEYLLKSLRNFSLYEDLDIRSHHMHSYMGNFLALAEGASHDKGIRLATRIDPDARYGLVDSRAIQQVMLNLLSNAIDAVCNRDNPEIIISMKKNGKLISIAFEDNGCGIPENQVHKLFTAFFTTKPKGTGLGLPIAAKMLAKMNSTIDISSQENVGTTVTISIPEGSDVDAVTLPEIFERTTCKS